VKTPGLMKFEHFCYFFGAYSPKNYLLVDDKLRTNIKKKGVPKQAIVIYTYDPKKMTERKFVESVEEIYLKGLGSEELYQYIKLGSKKHNISLDVILKKIKNIETKRVITDPQHTNAKGL
jgi:hypothetical protein